MSVESDCNIELTGNPLTMPEPGFAMWLAEKGILTAGASLKNIMARAALICERVNNGKIEFDEMKAYFDEVGLMIPVDEN